MKRTLTLEGFAGNPGGRRKIRELAFRRLSPKTAVYDGERRPAPDMRQYRIRLRSVLSHICTRYRPSERRSRNDYNSVGAFPFSSSFVLFVYSCHS